MKNKRVLALTMAAVMSSVALAGCGGNDEGSKQAINLLMAAEPKTIDQSKSSDSYSSQVLSNVQEGLTRITQDENGQDKIEEGLAESWEMSEDGLTWTFHLRDAKWSDGETITAEHFKYGIMRTLNPETASNYSFLLYPIKNAAAYNSGSISADEVGVKVVDDKTIEFTLESPCSYFLDLTYFRVMLPQRQDLVEKHGDMYGSEYDTMVFAGPFVISEWVHNSKFELKKNENYWDAENVKLDNVTMKIIAESNAAMQELYTGSLDAAGVSKPEWIQKLDETGEFEVLKGYDGSTAFTFFNQSEKFQDEVNIFQNAKVRKAFILAENRASKIEVLRKGLGEEALGFVPPSVQLDGVDYRESVDYLPVKQLMDENTDPKQLLIEGLQELGLGDDPSQITITYLQSGTDTTAKEWAEFQQQSYTNALGINVEVEYVEWAIFTKRMEELDYQVAAMAWTGDYNDPNTFLDMWVSDAGIINTGWGNEAYDECIAKAANSTDDKERLSLFEEAERILIYEDGVISPESWRLKNTYVRNNVKNYRAPLFGTMDLKYTYIEE